MKRVASRLALGAWTAALWCKLARSMLALAVRNRWCRANHDLVGHECPPNNEIFQTAPSCLIVGWLTQTAIVFRYARLIKVVQHQHAHHFTAGVHPTRTLQIGLRSLSYHGIIQPLGRLPVGLIVHYNPYKTSSKKKSTIRYREERNMVGEALRRVVYFVHALADIKARLLGLLSGVRASEDLDVAYCKGLAQKKTCLLQGR